MAETDSTAAAPGAGAAPDAQLSFDGSRKPLFWLLLRNLGLTVVTVGIYRFWAKTRVRRFLWRHTKLLDDPLEYLGTGDELFVGFLIAIVILVPVGAIYSLLHFFLVGRPFYFSVLVDVAYYTMLAFLVQIAIHRMRRYRLTRTAWRGVRFGLDGSSFRYGLISFGYGFLSLLTLGLAHPWLRVATMRYFFDNARFGTTSLSLEASGLWLFKRWIVVAVPLAAALAVFYVVNGPVLAGIMDLNARAESGEPVARELARKVDAVRWWPLALFVLTAVLHVWYRVVEFRYLIGGVALGGVAVRSELPAPFVYRVFLLFWLALLFAVGTIGGGLAALIGLSSPSLAGVIPLLLIFVFLGLYGILRTLFVDVTLLKRVCATLTVSNAHELDTVIQSSADLPGHGEGLADALDVGGF